MILGIDVGNTNVVAALMNDSGVAEVCRYNTAKEEKTEYHKMHLHKLLKKHTVSGVIVSSVVPEVNDYLKQVCAELIGISPIFVCAGLVTGLDIKYDNPDKLGADLIAAAAGAVCKYGNPVIVVDIGTATTFSVISKKNEYLGGMIAAGPYTSVKALASMASQLPEIDLTATDKTIGTNTMDCMKIGAVTAHAAMIDGMIERVKAELDLSDICVVATGGLAEPVTAVCRSKIICDSNLIFSGLYHIYRMNV